MAMFIDKKEAMFPASPEMLEVIHAQQDREICDRLRAGDPVAVEWLKNGDPGVLLAMEREAKRRREKAANQVGLTLVLVAFLALVILAAIGLFSFFS